jgi:hypothetical protein
LRRSSGRSAQRLSCTARTGGLVGIHLQWLKSFALNHGPF